MMGMMSLFVVILTTVGAVAQEVVRSEGRGSMSSCVGLVWDNGDGTPNPVTGVVPFGVRTADCCLVAYGAHLRIICAGHSVKGVSSTMVETMSGQKMQADVEKNLLDQGKDVAVLVPRGTPDLSVLTLAYEMPKAGEILVWNGTDTNDKPICAKVELLDSGDQGKNYGYVRRVPAMEKGVSGSPLLNEAGQLVGISQGTKTIDSVDVLVISPLWMLMEALR